MKIKMKDAGESPEFGAFAAGDVLDETRIPPETMQRLIDRGLAEEIKTESTSKHKPPLRHEDTKKDET